MGFLDDVGGFFGGIGDGAKSVFNTVKDAGSSIVGGVINIGGKVVDGVGSAGSRILGIGEKIAEVPGKVITGVEGLFSSPLLWIIAGVAGVGLIVYATKGEIGKGGGGKG